MSIVHFGIRGLTLLATYQVTVHALDGSYKLELVKLTLTFSGVIRWGVRNSKRDITLITHGFDIYRATP